MNRDFGFRYGVGGPRCRLRAGNRNRDAEPERSRSTFRETRKSHINFLHDKFDRIGGGGTGEERISRDRSPSVIEANPSPWPRTAYANINK